MFEILDFIVFIILYIQHYKRVTVAFLYRIPHVFVLEIFLKYLLVTKVYQIQVWSFISEVPGWSLHAPKRQTEQGHTQLFQVCPHWQAKCKWFSAYGLIQARVEMDLKNLMDFIRIMKCTLRQSFQEFSNCSCIVYHLVSYFHVFRNCCRVKASQVSFLGKILIRKIAQRDGYRQFCSIITSKLFCIQQSRRLLNKIVLSLMYSHSLK